MSKQINNRELAEIIANLLTNPDCGEIMSMEAFEGFMTDIAEVICDYCGGEVRNRASYLPHPDAEFNYYVGIHGNDSLPEGGGVWAEYDKEGELFDTEDRELTAADAEFQHPVSEEEEGKIDAAARGGVVVVPGYKTQDFEPFELVIDAYACDEDADGPAYAVVTVDRQFVAQLQRLNALIKSATLESVTISLAPDRWDCGDDGDDLDIGEDSLKVFEGEFVFEGYPKHACYTVETRLVSIDELRSIAKAGSAGTQENNCFRWANGRLYYAGDPGLIDDIIDMVEAEAVQMISGPTIEQIVPYLREVGDVLLSEAKQVQDKVAAVEAAHANNLAKCRNELSQSRQSLLVHVKQHYVDSEIETAEAMFNRCH